MEPQHESPLSFKQVIFGSLIFVVGIIAGAVASYSSSYQSGFNAAKTVVENSNFGSMYMMPNDFRTIAGTVTDIGENQLTMHFTSLDPFADPSLDNRIVRIDSSTVITSPISPTVPAAMGNIDSSSTSTVAAMPPESPSVVAFSNIKVGDAISVTANENIRSVSKFLAKEIQIQQRTAVQ